MKLGIVTHGMLMVCSPEAFVLKILLTFAFIQLIHPKVDPPNHRIQSPIVLILT